MDPWRPETTLRPLQATPARRSRSRPCSRDARALGQLYCPVNAEQADRESASRTVSTRTAVRLVVVVLLTTLAVLLALWLLYRLQTIVVWSMLALFDAVALNPSVKWLASRHVPRALAILVML